MTTYDKLIATDLASLARDSRRGVRTVDEVLAALEPAPRADTAPLDAVMLARVFASRVARGATGAVALLMTLGLWRLMYRPDLPRDPHFFFWPEMGPDWEMTLLQTTTTRMVLALVLGLLAAYAIASAVARGWLARRLRSEEGPAAVARLAQAIGRPTLILALAGLPALVLLVAVAAVSVGHERWVWMLYLGGDIESQVARLHYLKVLVVGVGAIGLGAMGIGLFVRRPALSASPGIALVSPAAIYADRAARLAGGAVAGLGAIVAVIAWHLPVTDGPVNRALYGWSCDRTRLATTMLIAILGARQLARAWAARQVARAAERPGAVERVIGLARGLDGGSASVGAGGVAALGVTFALASIATGDWFGAFVEPHGPRLARVVWLSLRVVTPAVPLAFAVCAGVARVAACPNRRRMRLVCALESRDLFAALGVLSAGLIFAGARLDFGVDDVSAPAAVPPGVVELGLSIATAIAVAGFVTSYVLRRRAREQL